MAEKEVPLIFIWIYDIYYFELEFVEMAFSSFLPIHLIHPKVRKWRWSPKQIITMKYQGQTNNQPITQLQNEEKPEMELSWAQWKNQLWHEQHKANNYT